MALETLQEVFIDQLKDLYSAENQLVKALPKMAKAASSPELKRAFEEHLEQTRDQVDRLEQVFEIAGASGKGKKCVGMEGLIEEGKEIIEMRNEGSPAAIDAALIAAAQRVEHYEIAAYGTVCTYAKILGMRDALDLLKETMSEEEATDKRLSQIAATVNVEAAEARESMLEETRGSRGGRRTRSAR